MSTSANHLVLGYGEVGKAIYEVLSSVYTTHAYDPKYTGLPPQNHYNTLHICYPCPDRAEFISKTRAYINRFKPKLVIIHATVPVGTTQKLGDIAVHSPVRGVHPNLAEGIRTFYKYFGGKRAHRAASIFKLIGMPTKTTRYARNTEALKLWDTSQYGVMIMLEKEIHKYCKKHKLDFDLIYTHANQTYNMGYTVLDRFEVVRPYLKHMPGKIGGHCVLPNAKLLDNEFINKILC